MYSITSMVQHAFCMLCMYTRKSTGRRINCFTAPVKFACRRKGGVSELLTVQHPTRDPLVSVWSVSRNLCQGCRVLLHSVYSDVQCTYVSVVALKVIFVRCLQSCFNQQLADFGCCAAYNKLNESFVVLKQILKKETVLLF